MRIATLPSFRFSVSPRVGLRAVLVAFVTFVPFCIVAYPLWLTVPDTAVRNMVFLVGVWTLAVIVGLGLLAARWRASRASVVVFASVVALFGVAYMLWFVSGITPYDWWDVRNGVDSIMSFATLGVAFILGYLFVHIGGKVRVLFEVSVVASTLLASGALITFATGHTAVVLPLGEGVSVYLFTSVALLGTYAFHLTPQTLLFPKWFYVVSTAVLVLFLALSGLGGVMVITGIVGVVLALGYTALHSTERLRPTILVTLALALCAVGFWAMAHPQQSSAFSVTHDIHPSLALTTYVITHTVSDTPYAWFTGSGLHSFGWEWNTYTPAQVQTSPFWNQDFASGVSLFATWILTLGTPMLLLLVVLVLLLLLRATGTSYNRSRKRLSYDDSVLTSSVVAAALLFAVWYVPDLAFVAFACLCAGMCTRVCSVEHGAHIDRGAMTYGSVYTKIVLVLLTTLGGVVVCFGVRHAIALESYAQVRYELTQESPRLEQVAYYLNKSIRFAPQPEALRTQALLNEQGVAAAFSGAVPAPGSPRYDSALHFAQVGAAATERAIHLSPEDYRNYSALGRAYTQVWLLVKDNGDAKTIAEGAYKAAYEHAPTRPTVLANLAEFADMTGDTDAAIQYAQKALALKPNYVEMQDLLERMQTP